MNRVGIILAAIILASLVAFAWLHQRTMLAGLPPREQCDNRADAMAKAGAFAKVHGGTVIAVLGTGSMAPYIPAAPVGEDPRRYVAAYVVIMPSAFADIRAGSLCIYRAEWDAKLYVLHQAAQRDDLGWVMSGLHNPRSESQWRVTPTNFVGIAGKVFVF